MIAVTAGGLGEGGDLLREGEGSIPPLLEKRSIERMVVFSLIKGKRKKESLIPFITRGTPRKVREHDSFITMGGKEERGGDIYPFFSPPS